jgi:Flp pilus assembly protein TadD
VGGAVAAAAAGRAAESAPQDAQVRYLLAQMLDRVGEANEAIAACEQTLRISPSHLGAHNDLGTLLATQGRLKEAIGHFEEALRIDPQDKQAQHNLARTRADLIILIQEHPGSKKGPTRRFSGLDLC